MCSSGQGQSSEAVWDGTLDSVHLADGCDSQFTGFASICNPRPQVSQQTSQHHHPSELYYGRVSYNILLMQRAPVLSPDLLHCAVLGSIGIMANTVLLLFHVLTFLLEHRLKPPDLTTGHLALIYSVMLLTVGFIAIDILGFQDLGDDITCKCVIYLYRVMRGLSICTTCLLSVLQAITLSPRSSCLAKLKQKSLHQNLCCFVFLWVFNMLNSGCFLISTVATPSVTSSLMFITQSCSLLPISSSLKYISISLLSFQHTYFIGLMVLSNMYTVLLLCRHKRQSQSLHSSSLSSKASPEQRAT
ncbi:LOW QUALITY PROTEIN: vomeronasal type-1 receptor 45-like [Erethizon dorsatum]